MGVIIKNNDRSKIRIVFADEPMIGLDATYLVI